MTLPGIDLHNPTHPTQSPNAIISSRICLILLLLFSLFFAAYNSGTAYSSDEVWSVRTASLDYAAEMAALKADVHPPLYFQLLHGWIRLVGTGERAVRSLSGVFYILAALSLYGLGRELYGSRAGLFSAAIYISSPLAILSAQFARMYSLLSLLSILSTWLYLHFSLKRRQGSWLVALYVAVNVLGTFTHIAFFFVLFAQAAFALLSYRLVRIKTFAIAIFLSAVPYLLLWAPVLVKQIRTSSEGLAWVKSPGISMIGDLFLLYGGAIWLFVPVLLYLWWRNGFRSSAGPGEAAGFPHLPFWLLTITLSAPLLISIVKPIFNSRLAIVGLHLFALTAGAIVARAAGYIWSLLLITLTVCFGVLVHPASEACDNRALARYLSQNAADGDAVIFTSLTRLPVDYYLDQTPEHKKLFETSFPAEIDRHPGYEGRINDPERRTALEQEAQELIDNIKEMQLKDRGLRVYFFHGSHAEVDSIIETRLKEQFELVPDQEMRCSEGSPYLKQVSVYKGKG